VPDFMLDIAMNFSFLEKQSRVNSTLDGQIRKQETAITIKV